MKLILRPGEPDYSPEILEKAQRLHFAEAEGFKFFALEVAEPKATAEWILASFFSPITIVPIPSRLPPPAKAALLAQLPKGKVTENPPAPLADAKLIEKPLGAIWCVIFSSGSTGQPKGIALSGAAFRASALAHEAHSQARNATWLLDLSLAHVGGFSILTRAHFLNGKVALGAPKFSPEQTLAWCRAGQVEGLSVVPVTLKRLLQTDAVPKDFAKLRCVLVGGAPADEALIQEGLARGLPLRRTYGATETCSQVATERSAGGGMAPLPAVQFRTAKDGELCVASPTLASGYFRGGQLEPLPEEEGYFPTGDIGRLTEHGLVIDGRKSERINSGGVKVFPAEVEAALLGCAGIKEAAAFGVPDSEWGEAVCLVVVADHADAASVKAHLSARLDPRKVPKRILFIDELPRSPSGKVLRAELRRQVLDKAAN